MVVFASQLYPTPPLPPQCGQKHDVVLKQLAFGGGPHWPVIASCMSTVGMFHFRMMLAACALRSTTTLSMVASHIIGDVRPKMALVAGARPAIRCAILSR